MSLYKTGGAGEVYQGSQHTNFGGLLTKIREMVMGSSLLGRAARIGTLATLLYAPLAYGVQRNVLTNQDNRTFQGAAASDGLGFALGIGVPGSMDVNGDGIDDMVMAANNAVYIKYGNANDTQQGTNVTHDLSLTTEYDVKITGANLISGFTPLVLALGDFDDDGFADVAMAAPEATVNGKTEAGRINIVAGASNLPQAIDYDNPPAGVATKTVYGDDAADFLGTTLAVGDVDNDGIQDLLAGAEGGAGPSDSRTGAGEAYIIFGDAGFFSDADLDLAVDPEGSIYSRFFGRDAGDQMSFVGAGDMDGDAITDFFLGAHLADGDGNGKNQAGEIYRYAGRASWNPTYDIADGGGDDPDNIVYGAEQSDSLGASFFALGNIDGQGNKELVFSAQRANSKDDAEVDGTVACNDGVDNDGDGFTDYPADTGCFSAQDIDEEKIGDRPFGGETYVLKWPLAAVVNLATDTPDMIIYGAKSNDASSVLGVADMNADGLDDVLVKTVITSYTNPENPTETLNSVGRIWTSYGENPLPAEKDLKTADVDILISAIATAYNVSKGFAIGDFNDDGFPDLFVGATEAAPLGRAGAGEALMFISPMLTEPNYSAGCWEGDPFVTCWDYKAADFIHVAKVACGAPTETHANICDTPITADHQAQGYIDVTDTDDPADDPACLWYIAYFERNDVKESRGTDSEGVERPVPTPECP